MKNCAIGQSYFTCCRARGLTVVVRARIKPIKYGRFAAFTDCQREGDDSKENSPDELLMAAPLGNSCPRNPFFQGFGAP